MSRIFFVAFSLTALVSTIVLSRAQDHPPAASPAKNDYSKAETWLCRPGRHDACDVDLTTTVISANGKVAREPWAANPKAPIDCFYVYPTVSLDQTPNSDMVAGEEELSVVRVQAARFGSQCRVYAPLYRQVTLAALRLVLAGKSATADWKLAYNDVLDAWNYYLKNDNQGRGIVLIGHSQGSGMLTEIIKHEIDGKPIQKQLISALLLGTNLPVPRDKDVGGAFQQVPLCRDSKQIGCVITYVSFRSNTPPPENSRFAKVAGQNLIAGCANPAALKGGSGELHAYLSTRGSGTSAAPVVRPWSKDAPAIDTPFVSVPGMLTAECVSNEKGSYLAVTVHSDPADPRTDEITGDVVREGKVLPEWGLHLIDVNLSIGNLIDVVRDQAKTYRAATKKHTNH